MRFTVVIFGVILGVVGVAAAESTIAVPFPQEVVTVFQVKDGLPEGKVDRIWFGADGAPVVQAANGAMRFEGTAWVPATTTWTFPEPPKDRPAGVGEADVLAWVASDKDVYLGTVKGLFHRSAAGSLWREVLPNDGTYSWALTHVRVLAFDTCGRLWFGAEQGVGFWDGTKWKLFTGHEGLPYNKFTCIAPGEDGVMWFGTEKGAIRADGERFAYRFSRRWLPDDYVNGIAVEKNGTAWFATNNGVGRIVRRPMTLEEKAAYFTDQTEKRHVRMGFVADCRLTDQYNVNSWQPKLTDNDGLYTSSYGAAQVFRYAVTKDPQAKALAKRSFDACKWLVDMPGEAIPKMRGFPARVIIPADWPENVNEEYGAAYNERKVKRDPFWKMILPRYNPSKDGKYLWKNDTSSDELAGHYFFYAVYYDLVAQTEEEKQPVREVVRAITDHLIRNGYLLRDHDGKPTRWGNFSPEYLNSIWGDGQRGLNSAMMLSFLNVARHVTGDAKYAKAAKYLRDKHHYHINAMDPKPFFPPSATVPWDNNLCLMSMYSLIKYEDDPALKLMYGQAAEKAWLYISNEKNAFWNTIHGAIIQQFSQTEATGVYASGTVLPEGGAFVEHAAKDLLKSDPRMNDALETLRGIPLDLIGYRMDNTHRLDVIVDRSPGQDEGIGWHIDGRALPIEERGHVRQDRGGFVLDMAEGSGYAEHEGTFFLLPYYMARYHGLIR